MAWLRESPTRWLWFGVGTGVLSGLAAVVFFLALEAAGQLTFGKLAHFSPPAPPGDRWFEPVPPGSEPRRWLLVLLPALGGLLSGVLVYRFAPEARGHGIDETIRSFHRGQGVIRARVPLVKGLATVATLATGGSAGKEGPIAQIGAGIGSVLATRLGLSARDRRILLLAGAAGGLGAIFRAPLGSAIIGSGGSGGVFGPTLFIGGMMGGVVGFGGSQLAPQLFPHPEAYVLVGMGSFFAGVASAPIGAMLMVAEMTGGYALLPPLMLPPWLRSS